MAVAGLRREQPRAQMDVRAARKQGRGEKDADRLPARRGRPGPYGLGSPGGKYLLVAEVRPGGLEGGGPGHRAILWPVRRPSAGALEEAAARAGGAAGKGRVIPSTLDLIHEDYRAAADYRTGLGRGISGRSGAPGARAGIAFDPSGFR